MSADKENRNLSKYVYWLVLLSFLIPVIYLVFRIITLDPSGDPGKNTRAYYFLMLADCLAGLIAIHIPSLIARRFRIEIPGLIYIMYMIFMYCAIFLGEVRSFYDVFPHFDDFLHTLSSMMNGFLALMFLVILNRDENIIFNLSPFFVALFAFTFSLAIGSLWEIYEYVGDGLLGLNMQRFIANDGTMLAGRAALYDTMKDIIVDALGAFVSSVIGWISIHHSRRWFIPGFAEKTEKGQ